MIPLITLLGIVDTLIKYFAVICMCICGCINHHRQTFLTCNSLFFFFFQSIDEYANRLIDSNHYASDEVRERRDGIVERRQNIEELSKARRSKLEESRKLQQFERDADEVKSWITEKLKIACDESYKVRKKRWWDSL